MIEADTTVILMSIGYWKATPIHTPIRTSYVWKFIFYPESLN